MLNSIWWQITAFYQNYTFLRVTNNRVVLVLLNFSDSRLDLDFSRIMEMGQ